MVPAKRSAVTLGGVITDLYTFEICRTATAPTVNDNACPSPGYTGLSGTRLALDPGDALNIRLVNKLPAANAPDTPHIADQPLLVNNPTNVHTLIRQDRRLATGVGLPCRAGLRPARAGRGLASSARRFCA